MFYIGAIWFASTLIAMQWFCLIFILYAVNKFFPDDVLSALAWAKTITGYEPLLIPIAIISAVSIAVSYYAFSKNKN